MVFAAISTSLFRSLGRAIVLLLLSTSKMTSEFPLYVFLVVLAGRLCPSRIG